MPSKPLAEKQQIAMSALRVLAADPDVTTAERMICQACIISLEASYLAALCEGMAENQPVILTAFRGGK